MTVKREIAATFWLARYEGEDETHIRTLTGHALCAPDAAKRPTPIGDPTMRGVPSCAACKDRFA